MISPKSKTISESKTKSRTGTPSQSKSKTKTKTKTKKDTTKLATKIKLSAIPELSEPSKTQTQTRTQTQFKKIKTNCGTLYETIKDNIHNLNISDKEYQDLLKCVESENYENFKEFDNEDIDSLYPHLDDKNFNAKLSIKKEFDEVKIKEKTRNQIDNIEKESNKLCKPSIEFELEPHQMFVRNFLSFETPYNSLLLFHGLGTGKTCSSIQVCEEMRTYYKQLGINKKIIIVASPVVQENYKLQLFDSRKLKKVNNQWNIKACTGNKFIQEVNPMNMKGLTKDKIVKQIKKIIKQSYEFVGYIEFANRINDIIKKAKILESDSEREKKRKMRTIKKEYSDRLLVIDEVHNIRAKDITRRTTKNLLDLVTYAENMKLLLLTATPMFNDAREIIWLTNLMNLNDKRFPIKIRDVFNKEGNFLVDDDGNNIGKNLLIQKLTGYVSYVSGENPFTFPYRIFPYEAENPKSIKRLYENNWNYPTTQINGLEITDEMKIKNIDIVIEKLHPKQEKAYEYVIHREKQKHPILNEKKNGIQYTVIDGPLQVLNIFYPHEELESEEFPESQIERYLYGKNGLNRVMLYSKDNKKNFEYVPNVLSKYGRIFSSVGDEESPLKNYSSKIYSIIKKIQSSEGIVLIYSNYIDGGCVPLALALEEIGIQRYGERGKSLFKTPPVENMKINKYPAKYIMITGDKDISPNNAKELKACTDEKNINGEKVKVIIISKAGSEGLDFQNIRQVHILEPWFNLNRIDQIVGRGVRNKSHCALPFNKRNVEIFLYGSELSDNSVEAMDLYIYRLAEYKSIRIGMVSRILKENAADCLLNQNQQKLNASNMQKQTQLILSDSKKINFTLGHKTNSMLCDFMDCNYECNNSKTFDKISFATYNEKFLLMNIDKILQRVRQLFNEHYIYEKSDLVKRINAVKNYSTEQINSALHILITDKSQYITDILGRQGRLINIDNFYMFQPIELENNHLTHYQRKTPIEYKPEGVTIILPKEIPKLVGKVTEDIDILLEIQKQYLQLDILIKPKNKKNWALAAPWAIDNLVKYNKLDKNLLKQYCLEHIFDVLNINKKIQLLNAFYKIKDSENELDALFVRMLETIINKYIIRDDDNIGFCVADYQKVATRFPFTIFKLNENKWSMGKGAGKEFASTMLRKMIEKFKVNDLNKISNMIGFMTKFKKEIVFKTKKMNRSESRRVLKGQACPSAGETRYVTLSRINGLAREINSAKIKYRMDNKKKDIISIYEYSGEDIKQIINPRKKANRQNTALISPVQLCVETELLLRYLDDTTDKKWFFSTIEDTINNISEVKK